jgi:hypothetical protein
MKVLPCWLPSEVLLAESMSLKSKSVAYFSAGGQNVFRSNGLEFVLHNKEHEFAPESR